MSTDSTRRTCDSGSTPQFPCNYTASNVVCVAASDQDDKLALLDATHVRKSVAGLEIDMASIGQGYTDGRLVLAQALMDEAEVE